MSKPVSKVYVRDQVRQVLQVMGFDWRAVADGANAAVEAIWPMPRWAQRTSVPDDVLRAIGDYGAAKDKHDDITASLAWTDLLDAIRIHLSPPPSGQTSQEGGTNLAHAAIEAAQAVIGQCDCIMAETSQGDPKAAWRTARDAFREYVKRGPPPGGTPPSEAEQVLERVHEYACSVRNEVLMIERRADSRIREIIDMIRRYWRDKERRGSPSSPEPGRRPGQVGRPDGLMGVESHLPAPRAASSRALREAAQRVVDDFASGALFPARTAASVAALRDVLARENQEEERNG